MGKTLKINKDIFEVYEIREKNDNKKHVMREHIRKKFETTYMDKKWEDIEDVWSELSEFERNRFIYIIIRAEMLENHVDPSKRSRISSKLDRFINENMLKTENAVHEYNENLSEVFKIYYCDTDSRQEMERKYQMFCSVLKAYNASIPIPSYEEWIERNKIKAIRVFDYCQSYFDEKNQESFYEEKIAVSQAEIDNVTLRTLMKALKIKIDTQAIEEAISYIKNYPVEEFDKLLVEYDEDLPISKERQEEKIKANLKYMYYKERLEKLDFVKKD